MKNSLRIVLLALTLTVSVIPTPAVAQESPRIMDRPVSELIRMLGSTRFSERESAKRALLSRDDAVLELRRALNSGNAEIAKSAKNILGELHLRSLSRHLEYGRQGRIDVLVEWAATRDMEIDEETYWQAIIDIAMGIRERSKIPIKEFRTPLSNFAVSFRNWRDCYREFGTNLLDYRVRPEEVTVRKDVPGGHIFVCRGEGSLNGSGNSAMASMLTTAGAVNLGIVSNCIVFANDNVSTNLLPGSVVLCDGEFECTMADSSIVIARKSVLLRGRGELAHDSHLHAGKSVRLENVDKQNDQVKNPTAQMRRETVVTEGQRTMLGVRFFETNDIGVEADTTKDGVRVEMVAPGSPPAKAGLRPGDIVLSFDGAKTIDNETLRRQFRRAFVQDVATVRIQRGGNSMELTISFLGFKLP